MASPPERRPRVMMLIDALNDGVGGAERFAVGLALALPKERFEVSLCATRTSEGYLPRLLDEGGIAHFDVGRRGRFDIGKFAKLARRLRSDRIDVLHCHKFGSNVWGTIIGRACRVPVVLAHEHTWSYQGQPLRRFLDGQLIGRLATRFVAVSEADRRRMIEIEGVKPERTLMVPTGYVRRGEQKAEDLRAELGLPPDTRLVGTVAQLRPQKALDVLIEAFARLPGAPHLVLVGDGPSRGELEAFARERGVADRVHFLGTRVDLATILGALDVAAMSSDFEGMPLFAFECMAYRVPLVATSVGGLPDVIVDGETGLLVPPQDPQALADAVGALLADDARRRAIADAAEQRLEGFTMEAVAERFADLYDELLAQRAPGTA